jgi:tRNA-Thr(GGU) m(6)t(6)A37 methyltransferase TsaA
LAELKIIARIQSEFPAKFGIPRQSGMVEGLKAAIIFEGEYRNPDALRGLEAVSHLWLIWGFSEAERETWSPTVRPPRLGGNTRVGVFATRSPYRPNPLGLSSVKIDRIEQDAALGPIIHILGADLMDGTPIYDIKPYIPFTDSHPEAVSGFARHSPDQLLEVCIGEPWLQKLPPDTEQILRELLALDPRPSYQNDPDRVYGMAFREMEIRFTVRGRVLTVVEVCGSDTDRPCSSHTL